jgi:hypothetical protein
MRRGRYCRFPPTSSRQFQLLELPTCVSGTAFLDCNAQSVHTRTGARGVRSRCARMCVAVVEGCAAYVRLVRIWILFLRVEAGWAILLWFFGAGADCRSGDSYTQTGFDVNGAQPSAANPFGNPAYP